MRLLKELFTLKKIFESESRAVFTSEESIGLESEKDWSISG